MKKTKETKFVLPVEPPITPAEEGNWMLYMLMHNLTDDYSSDPGYPAAANRGFFRRHWRPDD